jgi:predicted permease
MGDLRFAARQLLGAPGFTAATVLTVALGVGATTTVFSVVDAVLFRSLRYDDPGQLVQVWEAPEPGQRNSVSAGVYSDWARHQTAFEALAAISNVDLNLSAEGTPERVHGLRMSPSGLHLLRARPVLGRIFAPDEDQPGKNGVVVLTHALWQRRFGGDAEVVGRTVRLNGEPHTVIGVLPHAFLPWDRQEFVVPMVFRPEQVVHRGNHWLRVIGRLKPGLAAAAARDDLSAISDRFRAEYPAFKRDWGVAVVPMHEEITGDVRPALLVLLGAVVLVLLIACANVANLLLARASSRQKEVAIRLAMGAGRARVVRQLLTESLLLAAIGSALGLALAVAGTAAIRQAGAVALPRGQDIGVDWRVLGFTAGVSLLTGLVFGLAPAVQASRPDLNETLKEGGRASSPGAGPTRQALIVTEAALAVVLLVGAGLLVNSFVRLLRVPLGVDSSHVLTAHLSLPERTYPDAARQAIVTEALLERIRAVPGVEVAGASLTLPLASPYDTFIEIPGRRGPADGRFACDFDHVAPGYFAALRVPLLRGRLFDARDAASRARVAVVNETFARAYFPDEDPIGRVIREGSDDWTIVGMVGDVRQRGLAARMRPALYRPIAYGRFANRRLVVRTAAAPEALVEPLRRAVLEVDPDLPLAQTRTLEEVVAASLAERRLVLVVLALFAGGAVLLVAVGLYGVIAYTVAQRTHEIGVRLAVGAGPRDVLHLFVGQGVRLAALGTAAGLLGAYALTRLLAAQLYGVLPTDPATFAAVSALLLAVGAAASFLPARRAARVDPIQALR